MRIHAGVLVSFALLFMSPAIADKKKMTLPAYVVQARTVLVLVDPEAGVPVADPTGNRQVQEEVEKAFLKWGRITPVLSTATADLIVTVRKGSGKMMQPTVGGIPTNDRPVIVQQTDSSVRVGVQKGRPPDSTQPAPKDTAPGPGMEVGAAEDTFAVYEGHGVNPFTDQPPVWRYSAKDALRAPRVQAVAEFRKAVEEAERQQKKKP